MTLEGEKVCVLCSGGMDSSFMLATLREQGYDPMPVYMDYGQKVKHREVRALKDFCDAYGFPRPVVMLVPMHDVFQDFWAVKGDTVPEYTGDIAKEYIPGRNILFAVKLAAFMQIHNIAKMALGAQKTDCMPDNNRRFFDTLEETLAIGMGISKLQPKPPAADGRSYNPGIPWRPRILSPLIEMEKADVATAFTARGLDPRLTWSCYDYQETHCGECWQCYERHEAFVKRGLEDPTVYAVPVVLKEKESA